MRKLTAGLAWLFVALIVMQAFLAGVGIFGAGDMSLHRETGYWISVVPLFLLVAGAIARVGKLLWLVAGLLVLALIQTVLPTLKDDAPFAAAFHPANAVLLAWLGLVIARRATLLAR